MNAENNVIIKIEHVSKRYRLGTIGGTTLRDEIHRKTAKVFHKEDPTLKIGQNPVFSNEEFYALKDITLNINKGEAVGIIGRNGAGKSTLLKLLCRVTAPTEGVISYNGRITSMLEVGTGFHPELTGRENIYLNGAILGMNRREIDSKIEDIIEFSECRQFIDTPVKRYSSGMKVKLAFSVSAHLDSEIMIMDEVLAVGDMAFQKKCLEKMREAASQEGRTILYVSHNMNTIRQLCERCIVLNQGSIIFDGDVEEAISIYLNSNSEEESPFQNLENRERPTNTNKKAFMYSFEYMNKDDCVFIRGIPMDFCLKWEAKESLEDVFFRMIIRSSGDIPIGLVQSDTLGDFFNGEKVTSRFSFDTSLLADGRYYVSIALFQKDDVGNSIILDHVTRACCFEIINDIEDANVLSWERRWWGSITFPTLKMVKADERNLSDKD